MTLFEKKNIVLNSGRSSDFKIECDALTPEDIDTLAYLISQKIKFRSVIGIPSGGIRLAECLKKYTIDDGSLPTLLVDDVLTTGGSMERVKATINGLIVGVVIFARGHCPEWIKPIFQMW